jgi:indole-3-glycerol phosphate synthase
MVMVDIVKNKVEEVAVSKRKISQEEMQKKALLQPPPLDMAAVLRKNGIHLIAEVKKASPSKGLIRADFDPVEIAGIYVDNNAAAISVLTESKFFQGSLENLQRIRKTLKNRIPLLRKDFIFDPYQVYESRASGADSILLIVAILTPEKLDELLKLSHQLKMGCLVEVHDEAELKIALKSRAKIIGINNRDLNTFKVDITTTKRLRPLIPSDRIVVSESGIKNRRDIEMLKKEGVNAVLIGEALMAVPDIAAKMKELL